MSAELKEREREREKEGEREGRREEGKKAKKKEGIELVFCMPLEVF